MLGYCVVLCYNLSMKLAIKSVEPFLRLACKNAQKISIGKYLLYRVLITCSFIFSRLWIKDALII